MKIDPMLGLRHNRPIDSEPEIHTDEFSWVMRTRGLAAVAIRKLPHESSIVANHQINVISSAGDHAFTLLKDDELKLLRDELNRRFPLDAD